MINNIDNDIPLLHELSGAPDGCIGGVQTELDTGEILHLVKEYNGDDSYLLISENGLVSLESLVKINHEKLKQFCELYLGTFK